jgi:8-oxo-dGTP pyrophosphatase MutT (NUDIX family)
MPAVENSSPVATPRLAASLILLRDGERGLEVMMVERAGTASFAAGAFVFPGGRVDETDAELVAIAGAGRATPASAPADAAMTKAALPDAALRMAAIRETFEECGLLLVESAADGAGASSADFAAMVRSQGVRPALQALVPFAHWITPPHLPKRFDTHFFIAAGPRDQVAVADQGEVMSAAWLKPGDLTAAAEAGRINLMFATYMNLGWLARHETVEGALSAARQRRIATVVPEPVKGPEGRLFRIPEAAGYGETEVLERRFRQV